MSAIKRLLAGWFIAAADKLQDVLPDTILALRRQVVRTAMPYLEILVIQFGLGKLVDAGQLETWAFWATGTILYTALAALERQWPWFGKLLGSKGAPWYSSNTVDVITTVRDLGPADTELFRLGWAAAMNQENPPGTPNTEQP